MSGHTNRKRRNGNNPRARDNQQRQRGSDNRAGQPKTTAPPAAEQEAQTSEPRAEERAEERAEQKVEQKSERQSERENNRPRRISQSPASSVTQPNTPHMPYVPYVPEGTEKNEKNEKNERTDNPAQHSATGRETEPTDEPLTPTDRHEIVNPRGRAPFAAASRGGHAYIPASGPRMAMNGQNGQNGHHNGNGHMPEGRRTTTSFATNDADGNDGDGAGAAPKTWRIERLNGGADTTPHEPFRTESRGEVGELIDTLHELFAQDRAMASQGSSARCGICYLHFPLSALEYREAEGFYVCAGCKRALGHNPLMMIRRQQPPHAG